MNIKFNNVCQEKQKRIINAAIQEFGEKGFENGSTDVIAKKAGIAKGSLFHYFGNKKNLYLFIVEYCIELFTSEILNRTKEIESKDFYERMKYIALIKQDAFIKYPMCFNVITNAFYNMPLKIKDDLEKLYFKYYNENMKFIEEYMTKYINEDLLKPFVKKEDAIFITLTLFEALDKKYTNLYRNKPKELLKNKEKLFKEFDKYIEIIKYGIYSSQYK